MTSDNTEGLSERLRAACVDWDGTELPDGAEPRVIPNCGELREAAGRADVLHEWTERLQAICEKNGALGGDDRLNFIADALDAKDKLLASANAEVSAMREFVRRHPAFSLIDLAEFEAFVAFPKTYAELEARLP